MTEKITKLLEGLTTTRKNAYKAEVERQKAAIEEELTKFLHTVERTYGEPDNIKDIDKAERNLSFYQMMDFQVLPEVEAYIKEAFGISVDEKRRNIISGEYSY